MHPVSPSFTASAPPLLPIITISAVFNWVLTPSAIMKSYIYRRDRSLRAPNCFMSSSARGSAVSGTQVGYVNELICLQR